MTKKQFEVQYDGWRYFHVADTINERCIARLDTKSDADAYLEIVEFYEELSEENEELKKENKELQITKKFLKEQCSHTTNEHKNHYSINHCRCTADDFIHELRKGYKVLEKGNKELKKRVSDLQKENYGNIDGVAFYQEENASLCEKISDLECENEDLKKENKELKTSKEYWREKCLSKDSYNKLYHKAPIWFTQSAKLTDKQANEIAEAINQSLKERRIKE